jgi:hypothetical protein
MQTLSQYLKTARKDYTYAYVCVYRGEPTDDSVTCIKQVSGDIDFVSKYFQNDLFGNHLILSGHFNPGCARVRGHFVTCVCTYRVCDAH